MHLSVKLFKNIFFLNEQKTNNSNSIKRRVQINLIETTLRNTFSCSNRTKLIVDEEFLNLCAY